MAAFLFIQGIDGESSEKEHKAWIRLNDFTSEVERSIPNGAKDTQRARGTTTVKDITINRDLDKSSVPLQYYCAAGKFVPQVKLHLTSQLDNKNVTYLEYTLDNVIIASYSLAANGGGESMPVETIRLAYTAAKWVYSPIDNQKGGGATGAVPHSFDTQTQTGE